MYKLVVVDDEESILKALGRLLSRVKDARIYSFTNPVDCLEFLDNTPVDLVISDYKMPVMTGIEFLEQVLLKQDDVIKVMLTAYADLQLLLDVVNKLDLYRFIIKPWKNEYVLSCVENALRWRKVFLENKALSRELKKRELMLMEIEKRYPGITKLKIDSMGAIVDDDEEI